MKKIFTLLALCVLAISAQAQITIYVKCETAPYLWTWGSPMNEYNSNGETDPWPGTWQMTETYTYPDTGESFWKYTFPEGSYPINMLFNNGDSEAIKQTSDITSVRTDRYFILSWDDGEGNVSLEDVTEDYSDVVIPDAEVESVMLVGNHNGWNSENQAFEVVEAGKSFKITVNYADISADENLWQFKFRPNAQEWVGYWDVYYDEEPVEGKSPKSDAPSWLGVSNDGNFQIDLEDAIATSFTFTATWNGGKDAGKNWEFKAEAAGMTGINTMKANNSTAVRYNLQGLRVQNNYRGLVIQNGKKMLVIK